jgi:hypothetical protein
MIPRSRSMSPSCPFPLRSHRQAFRMDAEPLAASV